MSTDKFSIDRRGALQWLSAAALCGLPQMSARAQGKRWRVAFASIDDASAFGSAVAASVKAAASRMPSIDLTVFDNRGDAAIAVENARSVATAGFDLMIEYNGQAASNLPISRILSEAGVKVLALQVPVPGAPLLAVDNAAAGTESGQVLASEGRKRWPNDKPVLVIIGLPEAGPVFLERGAAARATMLKTYPGEKVEEFSSKGDVGYVRQTLTDLLTRYPGRKLLVWVHVDEMALAAVSAVRNADRAADVLVATTGGSKSVFPEIRRAGSPLIGTYSFFPALWGDQLLKIADRMLRGEAVEARHYPQRQLFLTAQNLAQNE